MAFKFESLEIWKESMDFSDKVFEVTKSFPKEELFNLTLQLRRSADSIPTNIAEGCGGTSIKDFQNYLNISLKSCYETISSVFKVKRRKYISEKTFNELYSQAELLVKRIIAFRNSLSKRGSF